MEKVAFRIRILPFVDRDLKKGKTVRMAGFRAQIPTRDLPNVLLIIVMYFQQLGGPRWHSG